MIVLESLPSHLSSFCSRVSVCKCPLSCLQDEQLKHQTWQIENIMCSFRNSFVCITLSNVYPRKDTDIQQHPDKTICKTTTATTNNNYNNNNSLDCFFFIQPCFPFSSITLKSQLPGCLCPKRGSLEMFFSHFAHAGSSKGHNLCLVDICVHDNGDVWSVHNVLMICLLANGGSQAVRSIDMMFNY